METTSPSPSLLSRLRAVGLRPTRQRLALARLLFDASDRHVTAEQLHGEALTATIPVSLATVYNTLHQFTEVGRLREVAGGRSYLFSGAQVLTLLPLLVYWLDRAAGMGGEMRVRLPNREFSGRAEALDEQGRLLLRLANGTLQTITAGDVFPVAASERS